MIVEIYTTNSCPHCVRAKNLLTEKSVSFYEIDVSNNEALREKMVAKANGRRTVPQIFIDGQHIGGCYDLYGLEGQGKLDILLNKNI